MLGQGERQFNRLMLAGLITGFLLLIAAFVLVALGLRNTTESSKLVQHTYEVKDTLGELRIALERSEAARRGYLLSPNAYRLEVYRSWSPQIMPAMNRIEALVADNPVQTQSLSRLRPFVIQEMTELDRSMDLALGGNFALARSEFANRNALGTLQSIREQADLISDAEDRLLRSRLQDSANELQTLQLLLVLTGLMLAGVTSLTFWLVRRFTNHLIASQAQLHRLNTDLEGLVAERTVGLQRANDEIQRFAYIVSHDLRAPLVNVMGFTSELERSNGIIGDFVTGVESERPQLVTNDVRESVREDLPEAIGFIRSSTQKMDRLIGAILALSRQGRRVLTPEQLSMDRLIQDIANSLAVQADEKGATIDIARPLPDLQHDRLAVEQIFSNLIENATKYLQPGRPGVIVVRGKSARGRATFEVEDNGRGIAPEDHQRIFDLFRRSGPQDQKGEGIGLAYVRALAYRLGGTVSVRSTFGVGSTFIVDLPVAFTEEGNSQ